MGTPFPWPPMVAIAIGLVAHSYAFTSMFPYVGYMVQYLGITDDKDEAGKFTRVFDMVLNAGYLSSAFMVGRFGSSYFWGRIGDSYGRLPVMYMGMCSIAFLSVAFGLSTTFTWAIVCRFLLGAMNSLLGVSKTMISEVCGREHETVGMSFVAGCWSIGLVLGPGLGGLLAEPAKNYPSVFPESGLFGRFPYLLPNIVGACLALAGLPLVFFFLNETLDTHKSDNRTGFEPIPPSEAGLNNPQAAVDEARDVKITHLDKGYNLEVQKDIRPRLHSASSGGGGRGEGGGGTRECADKSGCEVIGNGGCNGSSAHSSTHTLAEEQVPLAGPRSISYSGAPDLEGRELHSRVRDAARGSARSERGGTRNLEAGGGESQEGGRRKKNPCLQECLVLAECLEEKRARTIMFVYALFSFIITGSQEVYPLWTISTLANGGLDWTTKQVGQALSACGGGMLIFQLLIYPWIVEQIGAKTSQRWACCVAIPVFLAYPFLSCLNDSDGALLAASVVLLFLTNTATNAVFINIALATNNAVDPSRRNTINGLSVMVGALAKAAGPTAASTTFAWSIQHRHPFPFDQHLIFCLFALGMVVVAVVSWNIDISPVEQKLEGAAAVPRVVAEEAPKITEESV